MREAKKHYKPFWVTVIRKVRVLICNKCGGEMEHLTDKDALTIATPINAQNVKDSTEIEFLER